MHASVYIEYTFVVLYVVGTQEGHQRRVGLDFGAFCFSLVYILFDLICFITFEFKHKNQLAEIEVAENDNHPLCFSAFSACFFKIQIKKPGGGDRGGREGQLSGHQSIMLFSFFN